MHTRHILSVLPLGTTLSALIALSACGRAPATGGLGTPAVGGTLAVAMNPAGAAASIGPAGAFAPPIAGVAAPAGAAGKPASTGVAGSAGVSAVTPPPLAGSAAPAAGSGGAAGSAGGSGTTLGGRVIGSNLYDPATAELHAPAAADGVQIVTTAFDLPPGAEKFTCFHSEIPIDSEIDVHYYESKMAPGSHHFILYKAASDTSPVGTMDQTGCLTNFTNWIYSSAQPHMDLKMPEGVAMVLSPRQRVLFDMHYINTTDKTLHVQVALNVITAKGSFEKAAPLVSYNTSIRLPAHGMQTVGGDCTPGAGAKFFYMLTHTHRRGLLATITRVMANGQMGDEIIKSTNWDVPEDKSWVDPPYLTFATGEKFHYSCQYMNDLDQVVTAGPSANTNEMCMAITYYFPASAGGSCN
jgi:hypothetical protein